MNESTSVHGSRLCFSEKLYDHPFDFVKCSAEEFCFFIYSDLAVNFFIRLNFLHIYDLDDCNIM